VGIKTVVPERYVDIDDELIYFDNNPKKLERAKKLMGYGRRYLADSGTTVTDLCVDAANRLFDEMVLDRSSIDLLIFVNQKPDYREPCDACIAHGELGLSQSCATLDLLLGCSGYVYALWTAHTMIASGVAKRCLVLAGDIASYGIERSNRKSAQLFGDAASATLLEYCEDDSPSFFIMGTDGKNWRQIVAPFGGIRLPLDKDVMDLRVVDDEGNCWTPKQPLMNGAQVFEFTITVVPNLLRETIQYAQLSIDDIDLFALHQANKMIVESIASKAGIPMAKAPADTFIKYANNSTSSLTTVLCDQLRGKSAKNVVLCGFGIGLSWGCAVVDLSTTYIGEITVYAAPKDKPTRSEQIEYWKNYFTGKG
jgi:3-oxoacyl-[acyl-carrier-protein] synthase-3